MRIRSERVLVGSEVVPAEVGVWGRRIVSVSPGGHGGRWSSPGGEEGSEVVDVGRSWVLPGFIDTHVHGGGGAQFNTTDEEEIGAACRFHAEHGTTALLATTVAAPLDELVRAVQAIGRVTRSSAGGSGGAGAVLLGSHLEGPFISRSRPGAMDPESFLDPSASALDRLLACGEVRWMTLAPELPGALDLIGRLAAVGIVAALGHSDASYEQAHAAVGAGARAVTHLFNAMSGLGHRSAGLVGAALDVAELNSELICDAVHVEPAVLRIAVRAAGVHRLQLVTDATAAAGMPNGRYALGPRTISVREGRAVLDEAPGTLAGSTLTMDVAFRHAVRLLGLEVRDASAMASRHPARMLGLTGRKGSLQVGADADLVVLGDDDLGVRAVMIEGRWSIPPAGV